MKITLRRPRNATEARHVCRHKASYGSEEKARQVLAEMEATKVNPGALAVFACGHCNGWRLGTAFGPNPRAKNRTRGERKRAKRDQRGAASVLNPDNAADNTRGPEAKGQGEGNPVASEDGRSGVAPTICGNSERIAK